MSLVWKIEQALYVDDIIFGVANISLWEEFSKCMSKEFEISMMVELKFFLDFKSSKLTYWYAQKIKMEELKPMSTPMSSSTKLDKVEYVTSINILLLFRFFQYPYLSPTKIPKTHSFGIIQTLGPKISINVPCISYWRIFQKNWVGCRYPLWKEKRHILNSWKSSIKM